MTQAVQAYAAMEAGQTLVPFEYQLPELGAHQVDIEVLHCGICHSDVSMLNNDWGFSAYPLVAGHEVIGRIKATGDHVTNLEVGDTVGLGWQAGYCMACSECMGGHHNTCPSVEMTIVGRHGGFASHVRAEAPAVLKLPEGLDAAKAGPLLCGGITVFAPILEHVSPTDEVAVVGIGGLGHLAIQFLNKWGCEVTAVTRSSDKAAEAKALGAHHVVTPQQLESGEAGLGRFKMVLSTVNVSMNWAGILETLAPRGRIHSVGAVDAPLDLPIFPLIMGERSVGASPVGSPDVIDTMLNFAARHGIAAHTEHFPMASVNDALAHLKDGKARYRVVLDR